MKHTQLSINPTIRFSPVAPAKPRGQRPIDEERFADDITFRNGSPKTRVEAVAGVVAHRQAVTGRHVIDGLLVGKFRQIADAQMKFLRDHAAVSYTHLRAHETGR